MERLIVDGKVTKIVDVILLGGRRMSFRVVRTFSTSTGISLNIICLSYSTKEIIKTAISKRKVGDLVDFNRHFLHNVLQKGQQIRCDFYMVDFKL